MIEQIEQNGIWKAFAVVMLWLLAWLGGGGAQADIIDVEVSPVFENVGFLSGSEGVTKHFDIQNSGLYQATLSDFSFPSEFKKLSLVVTTATNRLGSLDGPGSFIFNATPDRYYASVFGVSGKVFNFGLYGVEVSSLAPVPIPGSIILLFSGITGLMLLVRFVRPSSTPGPRVTERTIFIAT